MCFDAFIQLVYLLLVLTLAIVQVICIIPFLVFFQILILPCFCMMLAVEYIFVLCTIQSREAVQSIFNVHEFQWNKPINIYLYIHLQICVFRRTLYNRMSVISTFVVCTFLHIFTLLDSTHIFTCRAKMYWGHSEIVIT